MTILRLRAGEHLPLRTLEDRDLDSTAASTQADPLLGILGALSDLPPAWRALAQLVVLGPAPTGWAHAYQRMALERPLDLERQRDNSPSLALPLGMIGMLVLYLVGSNAAAAWSRGDWLSPIGMVLGTLVLAAMAILLARWFGPRDLVDPQLVQAKISRAACRIELRLAVFAPSFADPAAVADCLNGLAAAYPPFRSGQPTAWCRTRCARRLTCACSSQLPDPAC